jgi:hypothetical protein
VEQLNREMGRNNYFLNMMKPTNQIFLFRLLVHLRNEKRNAAFRKIQARTFKCTQFYYNNLGILCIGNKPAEFSEIPVTNDCFARMPEHNLPRQQQCPTYEQCMHQAHDVPVSHVESSGSHQQSDIHYMQEDHTQNESFSASVPMQIDHENDIEDSDFQCNMGEESLQYIIDESGIEYIIAESDLQHNGEMQNKQYIYEEPQSSNNWSHSSTVRQTKPSHIYSSQQNEDESSSARYQQSQCESSSIPTQHSQNKLLIITDQHSQSEPLSLPYHSRQSESLNVPNQQQSESQYNVVEPSNVPVSQPSYVPVSPSSYVPVSQPSSVPVSQPSYVEISQETSLNFDHQSHISWQKNKKSASTHEKLTVPKTKEQIKKQVNVQC